MRDDIFGGLRNALERGSTLEQAIRSFVNAGYRETEVREAAKGLEGGIATMMVQQPVAAPAKQVQPARQPQPMRQQPMARTSFEVRPQRQRPSLLVIVLSFILLLSIAGFVMSLLFKKEIAAFLATFLGG